MVHQRALAVKGYTFVDYITQGYLALVAVLVLIWHGSTVPAWRAILGGHVLALLLIHLLIIGYESIRTNKILGVLRHFYPVLLYAGFYAETGWLNQIFIHGYLDPYVIGWDQKLFHCQPSLVFMQALPFLPISELFYASYFSYYVMIGGVGLALYLRDRRQFFHYVSISSFIFYICYLLYITIPVIGPPVFFRKIFGYTLPVELQRLVPPQGFPENLQHGIFYRIMKWIYDVFESPGAAIPSSHVAIALCTVYFSFHYLRPIRWVHLVVAVLLCLATVYCRYHYACDVLAGAVTALVLIPVGNRFYRRFEPILTANFMDDRTEPKNSTRLKS
jgi:membrane-associated phospholipid phosphatase